MEQDVVTLCAAARDLKWLPNAAFAACRARGNTSLDFRVGNDVQSRGRYVEG